MHLLEAIGQGAHSVVHRGMRSGRQVAVKLCRVDPGARRDQVADLFMREAGALSRIRHPHVQAVVDSGLDSRGLPYLITRFVSGETLAARVARGALEVEAVVELLVRLSDALVAVHRTGLIHRDVKPANVVLDEDGAPTLIDFGLAAAPHDTLARAVGSFAYTSPEQAGGLRIGVDPRADLYSLGAVAYECLVGRPPFVAKDVAELVRMHAQERPTPLRSLRQDVPEVLAAIVDRLLAKDPDDRYPTAASLHADLSTLSTLAGARLATRHTDMARVERYPLTGRQAALVELKRALSCDEHHAGSAVILHGAQATGVTRLGQELVEAAGAGSHVLWARAAPGTPLLYVVHTWLVQLASIVEGLPPDQVHGLRVAVEQHAGSHAASLVDSFSSLAPSLPPPGEGQGATPAGAQEHYDLLVDVLGVLSQRLRLTLAVDDAEHMDGASSAVVRRLSFASREEPVTLVVMTHELDSDPVQEMVEASRAQVEVGPLDREAAHTLISDFLACDDLDPTISAEMVGRTGGAPGALIEYARSVLDGAALRLTDGKFYLDMARLQQLQLPDDVAQFAIGKAANLDEEDRRLLGVAALLGGAFDVDSVSAAAARDSTAILRAIRSAQNARLARPHDDHRFAFVDARLTSWLAEQLPEDVKLSAHRVYASAAAAEQSDADLFKAATHYFHGADSDCAELAIDHNQRAGMLAVDQAAWAEARQFLGQARELSERFEAPIDFTLYRAQAIAHSNGGDVERGFEFYNEAVAACQDPSERASMNLHVAEMHMSANFDVDRMEAHLDSCWQDLGMKLPTNTPLHILGLLGYWMAAAFMARTGWGIGRDAGKRDVKIICRLVETTVKWAYFKNYIFVMLGMLLRPFYHALRLGRGPELASAYAAYCSTLSSMGFPAEVGDRFAERGMAMARELKDEAALTRAMYWHAMAKSERGQLNESANDLERLLAERGGWMNISDYFFAAVDVSLNLTLRGHNRRAVGFLERCLDQLIARSGAQGSESRLCREMLIGNRASYERPMEAAKLFDDKAAEVAHLPRDTFLWFQTSMQLLGVRVEAEDRDRYDEVIAEGDKSNRNPSFSGWQFSHYWILKGLCRVEQARHSEGAERTRRLEQLKGVMADLKGPAAKYPILQCETELFRAALQHFEGDTDGALETLGKAEALSVKYENLLGRYYVMQERARILTDMGNEAAARAEARLTLTHTEAQGWTHRSLRLRQEFMLDASVGKGHSTAARTTVSTDVTRHNASTEALRLRRDRDALLNVGEATAAVRDPVHQAEIALDKLRALLGAERAVWCSVDEAGAVELVAVRTQDPNDGLAEEEELTSLWAQVVKTRQAAVFNGGGDIAQRVGPALGERGVRSLICTPVLLRDQPVGVVTLDTRVAKGVFTAEDVSILAAVATQIAISQETARSMQRELERQALDRDLQLSAAVQTLLLPKHERLQVGGLDVLGFFEPASQAAGDFWYAEPTPDGKLRVLVGDVTGHGAGPAMVTALLGGCYRGLVQHANLSTPELLKGLDHTLRDICRRTYTVPFSALELDPKTGAGSLWIGASPPVMIRGVDGKVRVHGQAGQPLGAGKGVGERQAFQLDPGELLWVFSDGLSELPMPSGRELGMRRVAAMLAEEGSQELSQRRRQLLARIHTVADMSQRDDDLTFVLVKRA